MERTVGVAYYLLIYTEYEGGTNSITARFHNADISLVQIGFYQNLNFFSIFFVQM